MGEIPEDASLRREWNQLAASVARPEVFYTYEWAISVQRAYRTSLAPILFAAYEGDTLVGLVALAKRMTGSGEVVFLTADTADYCDFLGVPQVRQEFVGAILAELRNRDIAKIVLTNLPADSCSVAALLQATSNVNYHFHVRPAYLCARVVLGNAEERAVVKQSVTSKKRLRRNMRELEKCGTVRIQHDTRWDHVEPALEPFCRAHVARFLETGRISNLIREERRVFLKELGRELSASGWLTLSRLFVQDVTAAWNYGFRFSGTWFWYQPTVNKRFGDFSPGYCLLAKIVESACDSPGLSVVDLGLGAEGYKDRFATQNRQTLYCELNASLSGHARTVLRNRAARTAKASRGIERWIRGSRAHFETLKSRVRSAGFWAFAAWLSRRVWNSLFAFERVSFYEWPRGGRSRARTTTTLRPFDSDLAGAVAIHYSDDPDSLRYLMRSAQRLHSGHGAGFALLTASGIPVHFCWLQDFEGFEMAELDRKLRAPCNDAVLIYDCFTPRAARGQGFFAEAITMLADHSCCEGKVPWIFGAATNRASLRGIQKAGFTYKFSLSRRRILFLRQRKDEVFSPHGEKATRPVPTL